MHCREFLFPIFSFSGSLTQHLFFRPAILALSSDSSCLPLTADLQMMTIENSPTQDNGNNCGIFVAQTMLQLAWHDQQQAWADSKEAI